MADGSTTLGALTAQMRQCRVDANRAAAVLLAQEAPDAQQMKRFDDLDLAFAKVLGAIAGLEAGEANADTLTSLWVAAKAQLGTISVDFRPTLTQIGAVETLAKEAERQASGAGRSGDQHIFAGGTLSVDELTAEIATAAKTADWSAIERRHGTVIPDHIRNNPARVAPYADGFDGQATVGIQYGPGADRAVRETLEKTIEGDWLADIRAKQGQDAIKEKLESAPESARSFRILFGTNRALKAGRFTTDCSREADPLTLGQANVSVPVNRKRGSIPRPFSVFGFSMPENADKHILFVERPRTLSQDDFVVAMKADAQGGAGFLFVHGYNTKFDGGFYRTAQIAADLEIEGPIFHYAWPSAGRVLAYDLDSASVDASQTPFKRFVDLILEKGGVTSLNVIAHSKGNALVLDAFAALADAKPGKQCAQHLVLASPDVDEVVGQDRLQRTPPFFKSVTLYANAYDRPLLISAEKVGRARIGGMMEDNYPFIAPAVDSIDAANTDFDWFGLNHDAYIDAPVLMRDIGALFARGVRPPDKRSPTIRESKCERGKYYKVETA